MGSIPTVGSFSGPQETLEFDGFLFDMDGTIIDSTPAIEKYWEEYVHPQPPSPSLLDSLLKSYLRLALELGIDHKVILATSHGRRSIDTLADLDPSKANWECAFQPPPSHLLTLTLPDISKIEGALPYNHGSDASELPGARSALDTLTKLSSPWAIVTSGTSALLSGWLDVMSLPPPAVRVVAEDVAVGKPDPAAYSLGRERVGLGKEARILVLEDAPAGVKAGKAAGCMVLGLATTHSVESVKAAGADWVVKDLGSFKVLGKAEGGKTRVEIGDIWIC